MKHHGLFISVEGTDGAGKTSRIVPHISEWLMRHNWPLARMADLNTTPLQQEVRSLVLSNDIGKHLSDESRALLLSAQRRDMVDKLIKPALDAGKVVLTDRYVATTYVYQYKAKSLQEIMALGTGNIVPDYTFLCTCSYEDAIKRLNIRNEKPDHFEQFSREVYDERVRRYYEYATLAKHTKFITIDTSRDYGDVEKELDQQLKMIFSKRSAHAVANA